MGMFSTSLQYGQPVNIGEQLGDRKINTVMATTDTVVRVSGDDSETLEGSVLRNDITSVGTVVCLHPNGGSIEIQHEGDNVPQSTQAARPESEAPQPGVVQTERPNRRGKAV